jgi:undecaprenyl diphosphate synthase
VQSKTGEGFHVAIIMDGNGRWATRQGLPRVAGHRAGVETVRRVIEHAPELGINRLTLYAFSSDNWSRPAHEVQSILWLIRTYLRVERDKLRRSGARLEVVGRRDRLPKPLLHEIEQTELATGACGSLHLRIAVDYSSRDAITRAAVCAISESDKHSRPSAELVRSLLTQALTAEGGEVDLLIRTGGEQRLSDFLLWESAYAELWFTDRMWPDFDATDLDRALAEFRRRERRFGGVTAPRTLSTPLPVGGAQ